MELSSHNSVAVLGFPPDAGYPRLTMGVLAELGDLLNEVKLASLFQGVVIAANSHSFATGADIEEVASVEGAAARDFARAGQSLLNHVANFPLPIAAAIRGYCLGGGLDLALACHARIATYDASFGHPGASLGIITGWGGIQRLTRLIGRAAATQLLLTAERVPATQALTLGLVDELAPSTDLVEAAARRALSAARNPARMIRNWKMETGNW
ncbi:MAG: enoyl-CoA hydratase-related protein [Terriglobia bacterium]|jgi:enoyl-CoA hydratase/carnithine racemase